MLCCMAIRLHLLCLSYYCLCNQENFRVILIDFLGNGKSDRVEKFPENLWITQAEQVIALTEHLKIEKSISQEPAVELG